MRSWICISVTHARIASTSLSLQPSSNSASAHSQVLQVVEVVGQPRDIGLHVGTGVSAGLGRIGGEDCGRLHANHRLASIAARAFAVCSGGRNKGGCVGLGRRELEHLRTGRSFGIAPYSHIYSHINFNWPCHVKQSHEAHFRPRLTLLRSRFTGYGLYGQTTISRSMACRCKLPIERRRLACKRAALRRERHKRPGLRIHPECPMIST